MENIKLGDIVALNSGSCEMTVKSINNEKVICVWFVNDENKEAEFHKEMLHIISDNELDTIMP